MRRAFMAKKVDGEWPVVKARTRVLEGGKIMLIMA